MRQLGGVLIAHALVYGRQALPWPVRDRDYVVRYRWRDAPDEEFALIAESVTDEGPPPRDDVLRVPTHALLEGRKVLVVAGDALEERTVELGLRNWDFAEVVDGLAQGDRVVTSLDRADVRAGARVEVVGSE